MRLRYQDVHNYQKFLSSEKRDNIISNNIYDTFFNENFTKGNVLIFGTGLGYDIIYLAKKYKKNKNIKIYGCDYQDDLLDSCWYKIVSNKLSNVTVFFMPDYSRLNFPKWLPKFDRVLFPFTLSGTINPYEVIDSLKKKLNEDHKIHFMEWDPNIEEDIVDYLVPNKQRLGKEKVFEILEKNNYKIEVELKTKSVVIALTAVSNL